MGFNPYRKFRAQPFDYALVAACILIATAAIIWAFFG
jgi:hypothetical protein